LRDPMSSRFYTIPTCDTQTDTETYGRTHDDDYYARIASAARVIKKKRQR